MISWLSQISPYIQTHRNKEHKGVVQTSNIQEDQDHQEGREGGECQMITNDNKGERVSHQNKHMITPSGGRGIPVM